MKESIKKHDTDEEVEKMIKGWDKVRCRYCGKIISMLTAKMTPDKQYFICKGH